MDDLLVFAGDEVYVDVLDGYDGGDALKKDVIENLKIFFQRLNDSKDRDQVEIAISELSAALYQIRDKIRDPKV